MISLWIVVNQSFLVPVFHNDEHTYTRTLGVRTSDIINIKPLTLALATKKVVVCAYQRSYLNFVFDKSNNSKHNVHFSREEIIKIIIINTHI